MIDLGELAGVFAVFFGGMVVLTPLLAISARFALKPLLETMARLRQINAAQETNSLQDRKIELLEAEVEQLRRTLNALVDGRDFDQQLTLRNAQMEGVRHPAS